MPIPDYQTVMLPLLQLLSKGPRNRTDTVKAMADHFHLSDEERQELLPSGRAPVIVSRVAWALAFLKQAGLLETPKRGTYKITPEGLKVLAEAPESIGVKYLERFPKFVEFRQRSRKHGKDQEDSTIDDDAEPSRTPEEALEQAYIRMKSELQAEILDQVKSCSPEFFERLVIDLLVQMGYGGNRRDAGRAVGRTGDGGIDGIIKEDRLGLDVVYIQAKRWENTVGRPEIQKFAGALQGNRARKGVFITTAGFSKEARDFAGQ